MVFELVFERVAAGSVSDPLRDAFPDGEEFVGKVRERERERGGGGVYIQLGDKPQKVRVKNNST